MVSTNCWAYHTCTNSADTRASTFSPINRDGTEYKFRSTAIVLPAPTRTSSRLNDSRRRAGNGRNRARSSASLC
jgi:hypothetical protein